MVSFYEILNSIFGVNSVTDYTSALLLFLGIFIVGMIFDKSIIYAIKKASKKTKIKWDDAVADFIEGISWPFYFYLAFYIAVKRLNISEGFSGTTDALLLAFIVFYAAKGIASIFSLGLDRYKEDKRKKKEPVSDSMFGVMKILLKIVIYTIALLMILSNFGVEITPLIAGLGVGGIAVGLALQNILGDLFSAFAIYFDKPFEEGDFIIMGDDMGVVKYIGIKTTRIQALGGQELIMSNSELTSIRINNYKKMDTRRAVFQFGVEYGTSNAKLKKVKKITEDIVKKNKHAKLDRVHFKNFGDSSLNYEVVYYVDTSDYNVYMDVQEQINLELKKQLEKEKVGFAFPSRTIYMRKDD